MNCWLTWRHLYSKQPLDFRSTPDKVGMIPESIPRIPNQLDECNQQSIRMRPVHNQSFQQHPRLHNLLLGIRKEVQQQTAKVVGMAARWFAIDDIRIYRPSLSRPCIKWLNMSMDDDWGAIAWPVDCEFFGSCAMAYIPTCNTSEFMAGTLYRLPLGSGWGRSSFCLTADKNVDGVRFFRYGSSSVLRLAWESPLT